MVFFILNYRMIKQHKILIDRRFHNYETEKVDNYYRLKHSCPGALPDYSGWEIKSVLQPDGMLKWYPNDISYAEVLHIQQIGNSIEAQDMFPRPRKVVVNY
jgi:hypothetical protein